MSGLVGCWLPQPQRFHRAAGDVGVALEALKHRGPDDCGLWHDPKRRVILGHRRLAVVDLSPGGHQPMPFIQDQGEEELIVVFDGEIYNHRELQQRLETNGYEFYSDSDTEVLLAAYRHYGEDCVDHLRGMFAFAIWDGRAQTMLLARDRVGQKPLYYAVNDSGLYFASELNAIRCLLPSEHLAVDREAIDDYLCVGRIVGRRTAYKDVVELPPATIATCRTAREVSERRYWIVEGTGQQKIRFRRAVEETDQILRDAVSLQMRSDVPVAVLLSNGFDSGLIAALAAEQSDGQITTISVGFNRLGADDRLLAAAVSKRYGTEHHEVIVQPDICKQLPALVRQFGEPVADPSAVATYLTSEAAAYHCTVALSSVGCNELFCGHHRYQKVRRARLASRLLGGAWSKTMLRIALAVLPSPRAFDTRYGSMHDLFRYVTAPENERGLMLSFDGFSRREIHSLFPDSCESSINFPLFAAQSGEHHPLDPLERMMLLDVESSLPDSICPITDLSGMAHSLEMRSPFLDRDVLEWSAALPLPMKLRGRQTKRILRALAARYLPREIVHAPARQAEVPVWHWLTGELRELRDDLILSRGGLMGDLFDRNELETLLSPRGQRQMSSRRWSQCVWTLLMLALWDQECLSIGGTMPLAKSA